MMSLFILLSQGLAVSTSLILCWLLQLKGRTAVIGCVIAVFIVNNLALVYGLSEFWRERFHVYLVISILQGFLVYAAVITLVLILINWAIKRFNYKKTKFTLAATPLFRGSFLAIYIAIVAAALFSAYFPTTRYLTLNVKKPLSKPMKIALVSDTHLGRWFGKVQLKKLANLIADNDVDTVLFAGDIMNDSTYYFDKYQMQHSLAEIKAPLGVFAVLGNHDYSGNQVAIAKAVENAGIKVIDNKKVLLNDELWLVGRSDETDPNRPAAADLVADIKDDKPIVFLEHSPSSAIEISQLPIDIHFSGHTHGGQIFPLTQLMAQLSPLVYGTYLLEGTQFLVTSGFGFGAVPFRLGTRSEIWIVTLKSGKSGQPEQSGK